MKLNDLIPDFLEDKTSIRTPASKLSYREMLWHLAGDLGSKSVGRIAVDDLVTFCGKNDPAPNTVTVRRAILASFFEWAAHKGYVADGLASQLRYMVPPLVENGTGWELA